MQDCCIRIRLPLELGYVLLLLLLGIFIIIVTRHVEPKSSGQNFIDLALQLVKHCAIVLDSNQRVFKVLYLGSVAFYLRLQIDQLADYLLALNSLALLNTCCCKCVKFRVWVVACDHFIISNYQKAPAISPTHLS